MTGAVDVVSTELPHDLLLGLAGRVPAETLAVWRACLGLDEQRVMLNLLVDAVLTEQLTLTSAEIIVVTRWAAEIGQGAEELVGRPTARTVETNQRFIGVAIDEDMNPTDAAVVSALCGSGGLALWRATRSSDDRDVRLVECQSNVDMAAVTLEVQQLVAEHGNLPPQVECFNAENDLRPYHIGALTRGALVWARSEHPEPRLAPVFDGYDPATGPYFDPDHPIVDPTDRWPAAESLLRGRRIVLGDGRMNDVVSGERLCVPISYRTDGDWVWPEACRYYLLRHGLAAPVDLMAHLRAGGDETPVVTHLDWYRAFRTLTSDLPPDPG